MVDEDEYEYENGGAPFCDMMMTVSPSFGSRTLQQLTAIQALD